MTFGTGRLGNQKSRLGIIRLAFVGEVVEVSASFTANAVIRKTQAASFTADSILRRTQASSVTANAVLKRTQSSSFTADAILKKTIAASYTANAILKRTQSATVTADAVIRRTQSATFSANAVLKRTQSTTFTVDAVLKRIQSSTFTANAVIFRVQSTTFAANAVIRRTQSASFTADAIVRIGRAGSLAADAVIRLSQSATITANAVLYRNITASFTANAVLMPRFAADAVIRRSQAGSFTANAVLMPVFRADAVIRKTQSSSFTANAWVQGAGVGGFAANAVIFRTQSVSFTENAVLLKTQASSFTANAVIRRIQSPSFTADAVIKRVQSTSFISDAVIKRGQAASLTANAVIKKIGSAAFTADAVLYKAQSASFNANAVLRTTRAASFTANAVLRQIQAGSFTANAVVFRTISPSFSANAVIMPVFRADAVILRTQIGSIASDANITSAIAGSFTADAVIQPTPSISFTADAILQRAIAGSFTADAVIFRPGQPSVADQMEIAFEDHFERVDVSSWGALYPDFGVSSGLSIDGSAGHVASSLDVVSPYGPINGTVEFDFYVPADTSDAQGIYRIETGDVIHGLHYYASWISVQGGPGGVWSLQSETTSEPFTPVASTWCTAKLLFYPRLGLEQTKVWRRGDPEPDWMGVGPAPSPVVAGQVSPAFTSHLQIAAFASEDAQFTNFVIRSFRTVILYDVFTDITNDTQLAGAKFDSFVNGQAGTCDLRIRDETHTRSFLTGRELALELFGRRYWTGFIQDLHRGYYFDSTDRSAALTARYIGITGIDLNSLFSRRVLYNKTQPTQPLTSFPTDSSDRDVVRYYLEHHVDLGDDVLDIDSWIEAVGTPSTDGVIFGNPGETLGIFMDTVRHDIGSIYYIDPYRRFRYTDAETLSTIGERVLSITDHPISEAEIGCRDLEIESDAKNMTNDALVWGAGQGDPQMVFNRTTDQPSIDEHGRWQTGKFLQTVFRQPTVDRIASSMVYGSPQNLRGAKDDAVSIRCTVFTHRFLPADKVPMFSAVHGLNDTFPVRSVEVTWDSDVPIFKLTLSHELDPPWQTFEWIAMGPWNVDPWGPIVINGLGWPTIPVRRGDNFNRVVSSDWGIPSNLDGQPWVFIPPLSGYQRAVDGARGILLKHDDPDGGSESRMTTPATFWNNQPIAIQFLFKLTDDVTYMIVNVDGGFTSFTLTAHSNGGVGDPLFLNAFVTDGTESVDIDTPDVSSWINQYIVCRAFIEADTVSVKLWNIGAMEPGWTTSTNPAMAFDPSSLTDITVTFGSGTQITEEHSLFLDYIDIAQGGTLEEPPSGVTTPSGYICEILTSGFTPPGYPPGNYFRALTNFTPGSTTVWLDGVFLRPRVDYWEGDPYYGGFIHIAESIDVTNKVVYMCYHADPGRGN